MPLPCPPPKTTASSPSWKETELLAPFDYPLPILPLLDLSSSSQDVPVGKILVEKSLHAFSTASAPSGTNPNIPLFGSTFFLSNLDDEIISHPSTMTIGLPIIRMRRGTRVQVHFELGSSMENMWTNVNFQGLNKNPFHEGTSIVTQCGELTSMGKTNRWFLPIHNNSATSGYYPQNMFNSTPFIYGGLMSMYQVVSDVTATLDAFFEYGQNELVMVLADYTLEKDAGTVTHSCPYSSEHVACNWITCIHTSGEESPFQHRLYHTTHRKNVKLVLCNGTTTSTRYYIGMCDKNLSKKKFYFIGTDQGYREPLLTEMVSFAPGNRVVLYVDLEDFEEGEAYVFLYKFDHDVENNGLVYDRGELYHTDESGNPTLVCTHGQVSFSLEEAAVFRFLKISLVPDENSNLSAQPSREEILTTIRKIVFGEHSDKDITLLNYQQYLNPVYFYNLPDLSTISPFRRFLFYFTESEDQRNGSTEFCMSAHRIMVDMWNSEEYKAYEKDPSHPQNMPTCLFKIFRPSTLQQLLPYTLDIVNDTLTVVIHDDLGEILDTVTIQFPVTEKPLSILEWTHLVNSKFGAAELTSPILINDGYFTIGDVLHYSWEHKLFSVDYLQDSEGNHYKPPASVHSVMVKTRNTSSYFVQLVGNWSLLLFFGKPFMAVEMMPTTHSEETNPTMKTNLQVIFPVGGTRSGTNLEEPNSDYQWSMHILPKETYQGYVDGFMNDQFMNFSVKEGATEEWIYHNVDGRESHPFHCPMTSGYVDYSHPVNQWAVEIADSVLYNYSMDVWAVPPQQSLAWTTAFKNYHSAQGRIPYLGYKYQCNTSNHLDKNMRGQYFVYDTKTHYF